MRTALVVGGAALVIYWCWTSQASSNPNTVEPGSSMTPSGQDATTFGPLGHETGFTSGRSFDSAAAKALAKKAAYSAVVSKGSLLRAMAAINAQTPQSPAPTDPVVAFQRPTVRGTFAVTQIT